MTKQKEHYTRELKYHIKKTLNNGQEIEKDVTVKYHISREIASKEELDALELSEEILCILHESDRELINAWNREQRHDVLCYEEGMSELAMGMDAEHVFNDIFWRMQKKDLHDALQQLSESQRRRFCLHYGRGYSYKKIADAEGVSKESIRECVRYSKKKIMNILKTNQNTPCQNPFQSHKG